MRKSLILMLIATLLVGAFLVSCNSDISSESSNGDKLVKVTIAGNKKGISAVSTPDDADNYYWYYSATKTDSSVYRTGQTDWKAVKASSETGLSGADLGYFSSGDWKFSFYGYTTAQNTKPEDLKSSSVYYQEDNIVKVVKTTDTPTYVSVTLKEGSLGEIATLVIEAMNWKYTPENPTDYSATLANLGDNKTATIHFSYLSGTNTYTDIGTADGTVKLYTSADAETTNASEAAYAQADFSFTGNYTIPASIDGKENTIKFWVTIGNETVGDEDKINVVAYSGGVVTLSKDSTGVAVADNEAFNKVIIDENTIGFTAKRSVAVSENKSAAKTIVTKAAPSTESNALTSITFPKGALVASAVENTTYDVEMDVVVYQTEAAQAKFVIEDTSTTAPSTFAGLDISATLTTTTGTGSSTSPVSQFSDNTAVTIRTYIAKNLTGVQVVYNGSAGAQPTFSGVSFNSEEEFADSSYETGYVKSTGLLVFKTTHFSEFFVGANEKVYDKTTNTGYTVAAFNNLSASDISDHEFILLDASVANSIDDSRDVFNAGYKWTAIHKASEEAPSSDFAGGYGTKVEPYLITSKEQFYAIGNQIEANFDGVNIGNVSATTKFSYFKCKEADYNWDMDGWTPTNLYGCFNGNGLTLTNLSNYLFYNLGALNCTQKVIVKNIDITANIQNGAATAALAKNAGHTVEVNNVDVHGYIESASPVSYIAYSGANFDGAGNNITWILDFIDCESDAHLVLNDTAGSGCAGFIANAYNTNYDTSLITLHNSGFKGQMTTMSTKRTSYIQAHTVTIKTKLSGTSIDYYPTYFSVVSANGTSGWVNEEEKIVRADCWHIPYNSTYVDNSDILTVIDWTSTAAGTKVSETWNTNATEATVYLMIAPSPGAMLAVYDSESFTKESEGSFSTTRVGKVGIEINGSSTVGHSVMDQSGYNSDYTVYNVISSGFTYHNGAYIKVVQSNSNGIVSITKYTIANKIPEPSN